MRRVTIACYCVFLFVLASAQVMPQSSQTVPGGLGRPDRLQIESTLQSYVAAYARRSLPELLAVWPDLQNQKKEFEKIKRHLTDPSVSGEEITVQLLEIQPTKDGVFVRVHRTEQFVRTETSSTAGTGDIRMGEPRQFPGPYQNEKKKEVKKSGEVWITMRRSDDAWMIVSVSEKKPR